PPALPTLPYTTLFRSAEPDDANARDRGRVHGAGTDQVLTTCATGSGACSPRRITSPAARRPVLSRRASAMTAPGGLLRRKLMVRDRKSTRLNSSHVKI